MMKKNERKKIGNIIDRLLKNSNIIVCGLIGLLVLSFLLILLPLLCSYLVNTPPLKHIYEFVFDYLYRISLCIQVLVCVAVTVFSRYIRNSTWGAELTGGKVGGLSPEEKNIMKICEYTLSNEDAKAKVNNEPALDEVGWSDAKKIANNALSQFKRFWFWIWCSWLFLYMAYFIRHCLGNKTKVIDFFLNPLSNANTLMLLLCYLILFEVTQQDEKTGISEKPNWAPWTSLFLILFFIETIIRFLPLSVATYQGYIEIFDWVNGITSGAVMALFVGAFDNEFLKPKYRYTVLLYLYMVIQAIFPILLNDGHMTLLIFGDNEEFRLAIKLLFSITTLVCKIILFLFVFEQIKSGSLLFYFIRIRKQHYDFDKKWDEFLKLPEIARNKKAYKYKKTGRPATP